MIDMAPVANEVTRWLIATYTCIKVPDGGLPPEPEQYNIPKGKHVYLAAEQISITNAHPLNPLADDARDKLNHSIKVAIGITQTVERFKTLIAEILCQNGIKRGDELFVRDWPMFIVNESSFRERKFGYYGWTELFYRQIEIDESGG